MSLRCFIVNDSVPNNSDLIPHKGGFRGLFVKVLGYEGCPHFPADDVPGGECPHTTYYSNNSDLIPHKGGLCGLFVKVLGDEGSPHFPADDVQGSERPAAAAVVLLLPGRRLAGAAPLGRHALHHGLQI